MNLGVLFIILPVIAVIFYLSYRRCGYGIFYHTKKERTLFIIFTIAIIAIFSLGMTILFYELRAEGAYLIQNQWIASDYGNVTYCDNCLWIEFYEGCNRHSTYYFINQHEKDDRFEIGTPVNINFVEKDGKDYIQGVKPAIVYRSKCYG
jgi:hypothetical protein